MARLWDVQRILLLAMVFVIVLEMTDARGARYGGSRYGGSRYSSVRYSSTRYSRSSYRIRTGARVSTGARVRVRYGGGSRYNGIYIGGYRHYGYHDDDYYENELTICVDEYSDDGNGTALGRFVCPMYHQGEEYSYCCGPEHSQHCCTFFDDPKRGWGLAIGLFVGIVVLVALIAFCAARGCCGGGCSSGGGGGGGCGDGSWGSTPSFYDSD